LALKNSHGNKNMMKNKVTIPYNELLCLRKQLRYNSEIPNILIYEQFTDNSGYDLFLGLQTFTAHAIITAEEDIEHFEENIKQFCNKVDMPDMALISTHDYANNESWLFGDTNSFFVVAPMVGKEFVFHSILGKLNKEVIFDSGQSFRFVLWQTVTSTACPAVSNTPTEFGSPLYNPYGAVFTGWYKVFPPEGQNQKPNIWYYFVDNEHTYTVTEFVFENLDDFLDQSKYLFQGDTVRLTYEYKEFNAYLNLRSSKNERLEMYVNNDEEISNPEGITTKSVLSCVVLIYDEF